MIDMSGVWETGSSYMVPGLVEGEYEWLTEGEFFRHGEDALACTVIVDAPNGGITQEWREAMGAALVERFQGAGWDTLDESDDRGISEFVIDFVKGSEEP